MKYKVALLIGSESDRKTVEASLPYFEYSRPLRLMTTTQRPIPVDIPLS